jgi:hypothetical protein
MNEFDRPWTQVNWAELNRMERDIAGYYSHTLPPYGEQQYYELIGKYPQFNQGWNDAPPSFNYGDALTPNFVYYSGERGKANSLYASASRWVTVVIISHSQRHGRGLVGPSLQPCLPLWSENIPTQEGTPPRSAEVQYGLVGRLAEAGAS